MCLVFLLSQVAISSMPHGVMSAHIGRMIFSMSSMTGAVKGNAAPTRRYPHTIMNTMLMIRPTYHRSVVVSVCANLLEVIISFPIICVLGVRLQSDCRYVRIVVAPIDECPLDDSRDS